MKLKVYLKNIKNYATKIWNRYLKYQPLSDFEEISLKYLYDLKRKNDILIKIKHMGWFTRFCLFLIGMGFLISIIFSILSFILDKSLSLSIWLAFFVLSFRMLVLMEDRFDKKIDAEIEYRNYNLNNK